MQLLNSSKIIIITLLAIFITSIHSNAQEYWLKNRFNDAFLQVDGGKLNFTKDKEATGTKWKLEKVSGDTYRITNTTIPGLFYLNSNNDGSVSPPIGEQSQWEIKLDGKSNFFHLRSIAESGGLLGNYYMAVDDKNPARLEVSKLVSLAQRHWTLEEVGNGKLESSGRGIEKLKIMTYNVYLLNPTADKREERADNIAKSDIVKGFDILVLNENFDHRYTVSSDPGPARRLLISLMPEYPFQTEIAGIDTKSFGENLGYAGLGVQNSGLTVVSKHPIIESAQFIYDGGQTCGADAAAEKGFIYTKINYNGEMIHVIATHTQAVDGLCSTASQGSYGYDGAIYRLSQMQEMRQFLNRKRIPRDEYVFFVGDMNIVKDSDEYKNMLEVLNVVEPSYTGHDATWDPTTNNILKESKYKDHDGEFLDYIFISKDHKHPGSWYNHAIKTPSNVLLSDHYPVIGSVRKP